MAEDGVIRRVPISTAKTIRLRVGGRVVERRSDGDRIFIGLDASICRLEPLPAGHPMLGEKCPACRYELEAGDVTCIIPLGPGGDLEERKKAAAGQPYEASSLLVHWACASGEEPR